jgi:hypothetical protein
LNPESIISLHKYFQKPGIADRSFFDNINKIKALEYSSQSFNNMNYEEVIRIEVILLDSQKRPLWIDN